MDQPLPEPGRSRQEGPGAMEEADNVASGPGGEGLLVKTGAQRGAHILSDPEGRDEAREQLQLEQEYEWMVAALFGTDEATAPARPGAEDIHSQRLLDQIRKEDRPVTIPPSDPSQRVTSTPATDTQPAERGPHACLWEESIRPADQSGQQRSRVAQISVGDSPPSSEESDDNVTEAKQAARPYSRARKDKSRDHNAVHRVPLRGDDVQTHQGARPKQPVPFPTRTVYPPADQRPSSE